MGEMDEMYGDYPEGTSPFDGEPDDLLDCLNCDRYFDPPDGRRAPRLFCRDMCRDEAKYVRYARKVRSDGRIDQPDVRVALVIKRAHLLAGGYAEKGRHLSPQERKAVFARDSGRCRECGG